MKIIKCLAVILSMTVLLTVMSTVGLVGFEVFASGTSYSGTVYYVDADNGDDTNDGRSQSKAWQTLEKVNSVTFSAGDAILLKKGCVWTNTFLYPKGSGTQGKPITISTYGEGDKPVIKSMYDDELDGLPDVDAAVFLKNQSYIVVDGLYISNSTPGTGTQYGVRVFLNSNYTTYGIQIKNCTIYGSNVKNWSTQSKSGLSGITVSSDSYNGFIGSILIENNEIYNCKSVGISVNGSYSGCDKSGNINAKSAKNVVVRGNYLQNIGKDGIIVNNCNAPLVEYNTCNKAHSYATTSAHVAIWPFASYGAVLQYNEAYNTQTIYDGQGFDCDYQCYNTLFQYNYSHNNQGGFMLICCEPTDWNNSYAYNVGSVVRYNISQNDYHFIFSLIGAIDDTKIYNNTVYSDWALSANSTHVFYSWTRGTSLLSGRKYANNTLIANNIFYSDAHQNYSLSDTTNTTFANNLVYGRYTYKAPKNDSSETTDDNITASDNIYYKDPKFVNAGGAATGLESCSAYQLYENSPAIGAGMVIEDNGGLDFFGNAVSSTAAPNIGAYNGKGVTYNEQEYIIDQKYKALLDFEKHDETKTNTYLRRVLSVSNGNVTIDKSIVNSATNSTKSIKLTSTKSSAASKVEFMINSDEVSNSTGIRFWVSGNGTARTGTITLTTSSNTYTKSFKITADGGYFCFSWNEKYTGSNELRVTCDEMRTLKSIAFSCTMDSGESIYIDDVQKNIGEFDPEYTGEPFYYPEYETVLVEDFESYSELSIHGGNKYGGPSYGPIGNNGSTTYNGSRVAFATATANANTSAASYLSYSTTFAKIRNGLLLDGAKGLQFDMASTTTYASSGEALSDVDEYKVYNRRGIYTYSIGSGKALTVTASNGTEISIKYFSVSNNKSDGNGLTRIDFDDLSYYYSTTEETFYLKDFSADEILSWKSSINNLTVAFTTYAKAVGCNINMTWYMDNICVYGTFSDSVEKTTIITTTAPTTTVTTTTTTTTKPTTATTTAKPTTATTTRVQPTIATTTTAPTTTAVTPVYGDANSDGKVNTKDVLLLRKYLAGYKVEINQTNIDINSDSKINTKDLLLLRKYIAGYKIAPWY